MQFELEKEAEQFRDKLSKIKVCLFDVDGILTNGRLWWHGNEVGFNRYFHVQDGYGLKLLMKCGLKVGIISGGNSQGVMERFNLLGIDYMHLGNEDKREAYKSVLKEANVKPYEVLYMGDELFDIPLLKASGFSATVANACYEVRHCVDYITKKEPGSGCVREVIDMLRWIQGLKVEIPDFDASELV